MRRFPRRSSIVSFAGVDPAVNQSGKHISKSNPTTKRGSPHLRKTLYQMVCTYLLKAPAQNKFLRIYYARVKECLLAAVAQESSEN